jgi:hypothetical protein
VLIGYREDSRTSTLACIIGPEWIRTRFMEFSRPTGMCSMLLGNASHEATLTHATRFETSSMSGIFLTCSRFNHACHPHTTCTYTWDEQQKKLIVSTLRDIDAGEELTISYMGWSVDRGILKHNYGFDCDCPGCLQEIEAEAEAGKESAKVTAIPPRRHRHICF